MQDSIEVMQSKVEAFNKKNPVGAKVTVVKDFGERFETKVKHPAYVLSGHTAVAHVDGIRGCYRLDRII